MSLSAQRAAQIAMLKSRLPWYGSGCEGDGLQHLTVALEIIDELAASLETAEHARDKEMWLLVKRWQAINPIEDNSPGYWALAHGSCAKELLAILDPPSEAVTA